MTHRPDSEYINCHKCDRGGLGNAEHKCSCGWRITSPTSSGCLLGIPIVGEPRTPPKLTAGKRRYQEYLDSECGLSFIEFLRQRNYLRRIK